LGFDADGQPTGVQTTPSSVTVTAAAETVLDDATVAAMCDTLGALDVNNDDLADIDGDLDDIDDGTTYAKVLAATLDTGRVDEIDDDTTFENAQTRYFCPSLVGDSDGEWQVSGGEAMVASGAGPGQIYIAVHLPHGATVTELKAWLDSDGTRTLSVDLKRSPIDGTGTNTLATVSSSSNDLTAVTDSSISNADVDNSGYNYFCDLQCDGAASANVFIRGIRITYTITEPKP